MYTTRSMTMRLTRRLRRVTMITGIVTATTTAKRKARRNELWGMWRAGSWRRVVGWSKSGGGHATGLEGTSSAQYSEMHTAGEQKNTTTNNTDANTSSTTISYYQRQQQQQHRQQHQHHPLIITTTTDLTRRAHCAANFPFCAIRLVSNTKKQQHSQPSHPQQQQLSPT